MLARPESSREVAQDVDVGTDRDWRDHTIDPHDPPFDGGDRALLFGEGGAGQDDVGMLRRLGEERIDHDHMLETARGFPCVPPSEGSPHTFDPLGEGHPARRSSVRRQPPDGPDYQYGDPLAVDYSAAPIHEPPDPIGGTDDLRCLAELVGGDIGGGGHLVGMPWIGRRECSVQPLGAVADELVIHQPEPVDFAKQTVEDRGVGPGPDRKVQIARLHKAGSSRVDHNDRAAPLPYLRQQLGEDHRESRRDIGARNHHNLSARQFAQWGHHPVGPKRLAVRRACRSHAEAPVVVDMARPHGQASKLANQECLAVTRAGEVDLEHLANARVWPVRHHDHPVGEQDRFVHVVGYADGGHLRAVPDFDQDVLQVPAGEAVQHAKGFVEQEQFWAEGECSGQSHPLLHAVGQLLCLLVHRPAQTDAVEVILHHLGPLGLGGIGVHPLNAKGDVLACRQPGEQRRRLEYHGLIRPGAVDLLVIQDDATCGDGIETGRHGEHRRLTAPGMADQ
ncbi:hypothetical protein GQR58_030576 [Nymphon striatum]|nr:hypothetical protein GQR58_030576 [Nymphon striatum]